jgi:hypothetical protein
VDGNRINCDFEFGLHYCIAAIRRNPSAVPALSLIEWCTANGGYINVSECNLVANLNHQPGNTPRPARLQRIQKINMEILRVVESVSAAHDLQLNDKRHLNAAQGWLELGSPGEAERELDQVSDAMQGHSDVILMRLRIWAKAEL